MESISLNSGNNKDCSKGTINVLNDGNCISFDVKHIESLKLNSNRIVDMFGVITTRSQLENNSLITSTSPKQPNTQNNIETES